MRDVEIGVEAQLCQPACGPSRSLEHLVAQHPVGGVQFLRRPEQFLGHLQPVAAELLAHGFDDRERCQLLAMLIPGHEAETAPRRARDTAT